MPGAAPEEAAASPIETKPAPAPRKGLPRAEIKIDDEHGIELADDLVVEEEAEAPSAAGAAAAGGTFGGLFANKLKAALKKKREEGEGMAEGEAEGESGETASDENDEK